MKGNCLHKLHHRTGDLEPAKENTCIEIRQVTQETDSNIMVNMHTQAEECVKLTVKFTAYMYIPLLAITAL